MTADEIPDPQNLRLRLWVNDRTPPAITAVTRNVTGGMLRFRVTDGGSGVSIPDVIVRIDGTQEDVSVSADGHASVRVSGLDAGRHRVDISASDLQETKNSENASALALPNTRTVHVAFTVSGTG